MRFLLSVSALLAGQWLLACSCAPPPEPKKAMEGSAAVCLAEVVKIEEVDFNRTVTLKVSRWWKGGDAVELVVSTHKDSATCGYGFQKGTRYLVYAHRQGEKDKTLRVSLCSRTRTEKEAEKSGDFKELGEGKAPGK